METRDPIVKSQFDAIEEDKLAPDERERRVKNTIEGILKLQGVNENFFQDNPESKSDLSSTISFDVMDENGITPLTLAAQKGHVKDSLRMRRFINHKKTGGRF